MTLPAPELSELRSVLCRACGFDGWWTGVAAAPIPELLTFRRLLALPSAEETARHLLEHGKSGGIAYGLSMLWLVDHPSFLVELPRFKDRSDPVFVRFGGCLPGGEDVPLSALISKAGAVKLQGPKDTLEAWAQRNPGKDGELDIEGGGYPTILKQ